MSIKSDRGDEFLHEWVQIIEHLFVVKANAGRVGPNFVWATCSLSEHKN